MKAEKTENWKLKAICGGGIINCDASIPLKASDGTIVNQVQNSKYFNECFVSSNKETIVRIAQEWTKLTKFEFLN